jgi:glycosyltransferase involved in cell wall biosynthesis
MVAYHFPPMLGSSGIQRTLSFVRDLPALGWRPAVLTAHLRAYPQLAAEPDCDLPPGVQVRRAYALDTARHLSFCGRYPQFLALPDRWVSWLIGAVPAGLALIRRLKPAALWSTYPIATAHLVGYALARLSGLPWIADFRDPMAHDGYPTDRRTWSSFLRVEQRVFSRADRIVFATPGAAQLYRQRYPDAADRIHVIENGYDEAAFAQAESGLDGSPLSPGAITLLHSGIVYPEWRNPEPLLQAIRTLRDEARIPAPGFRLRFRASVHDAYLQELVNRYDLGASVEILPPLDYGLALQEMRRADALLVLQSDGCNDQIPAKLYEYIRARRPVLGLTDPDGDTAAALQHAGFRHIAPLDAAPAIATTLETFLREVAAGTAPTPGPQAVAAASRHGRAIELARLLDEVADAAMGS